MNFQYKTQTRFLFNSHIKIKIPLKYEDELFDDLFLILKNVDLKFNSHSKNSIIDIINKHSGHFVDIDNETHDLLNEVIELSSYFDGAYDITIMPLIRLWGFYNKRPKIPSTKEIKKKLELIDYKKIELKSNKVKIDKGQEIITGSFIKSYAVDKLAEKMKDIGIDDAIINAGGSTIYSINNQDHEYWQIKITLDDLDERILKISNKCFSTSAQNNSYIEIDKKHYGHILDPRTGYPALNKQIGIISDKCMPGDIISTALLVTESLKFSQKIDLLSSKYNISGFLLDEDGRITKKGDICFI